MTNYELQIFNNVLIIVRNMLELFSNDKNYIHVHVYVYNNATLKTNTYILYKFIVF